MKTSLNDNNEVSLKAYLKKPSLLQEEDINFGVGPVETLVTK